MSREYIKAKLKDQFAKNKKVELEFSEKEREKLVNGVGKKAILLPVFYPKSHSKILAEALLNHLINVINKVDSKEFNSESFYIMKGLIGILDDIMNYYTNDCWNEGNLSDNTRSKIKNNLSKIFDKSYEINYLQDTGRPNIIIEDMVLDKNDNEIKYFVDVKEYADVNRIYFVFVEPYAEDIDKAEISWAIKALHEVIKELKPNGVGGYFKVDFMNGQTQELIHIDMMYYLKQIAHALNYITNSYSWNENVIIETDIFNIKKKLGV